MNLAHRYGPWAVIAGASEGTGAAFARRLAAERINLLLIARRTGPLEALAAELRAQHGVDCFSASIDLGAEDAAARVAAAVGARDVGLFINNAGADTNGSLFIDNDLANWEQLVRLDVVNVMRNCHFFGRRMRDRGRGGIILVGSGACYGGLNGIAAYTAVKAFDLCLGEGLWAELRHHGVDVLNLILGRTDTPAHRRLLERNGQPIPAGMASPDAVADLGLARLPHGPVCNWGLDDDVVGYAPNSAAQRRARIVAIEAASASYAAKK
jgi:short-subunit dehydrogenase